MALRLKKSLEIIRREVCLFSKMPSTSPPYSVANPTHLPACPHSVCLQGRDSSMWVRAAPWVASPNGPLQAVDNSGTMAGAIAGIPSRNRGALAQGTDSLAAMLQSIHQSVMGAATTEARPAHPSSRPWPPAMRLRGRTGEIRSWMAYR